MTMDTIDALEDEIEVSLEDASPESETAPEEEVDPVAAAVAALRADIDKEYGHLKGFNPDAVKAGLGRIPSLQSAIEDLKKGSLTADVVERLDLSDRALGSLASLMLSDSEQSEAVKAPFREYISGMEKARNQRERNALRNELLDEIKPAAQPTGVDTATNPWSEATAEVTEEATENGIDPKTLPWDEFEAGAKGSPLRAVRLASKWISEHKPDPAAARLSERRRSVGNGSPQREASSAAAITDMSDADAAYADGTITHAQYKEYRTKFGLGVVPGGR